MKTFAVFVGLIVTIVFAAGNASAQDDPAPQPPAEVADPPAEPVADAPAGPVADAPVDPVADAPVGPVAGPVADAPAGPVADPPRTMPRGGASMLMIPRLRTITWNIELEGAIRLVQSDGLETFPLVGRLELGLLVVREPWFFSVSATGELGGLGSRGLGGQIELTHLWGGLWGHLGVSWVRDDLAGNTAVMSAAAGWALLGVEWQRQLDSSGTLGDALLLQLRAPLGILYVLRYHKPR